MSIKSNIEYVNELKGIAAEKSGRKPEDVLLVAVTKLHTPAEINEAIDAGVTDIGENKVQEIMDKYDAVKPVRWHLIGHLQTNKVKYIIDKVCMIHSVDSLHLAQEIDKRAAQHVSLRRSPFIHQWSRKTRHCAQDRQRYQRPFDGRKE